MLGYAEDEIEDRYDSWHRLVHPDDLDRALSTIQAYLDGDVPAFELEHRLRHQDGSYRWILARGTSVRDSDGRPVRMVGSHTDVAEQKQIEEALKRAHGELEVRVEQRTVELGQEIARRVRIEEALRASEAKYRDLVQNANSVILQMDTQGNITFFNRFAEEFFGYTEEEILGRNVVGTIVPATDTGGFDLAAKLQDVAQRPERYYSSENENVRKDGEQVWVAWTNRAIYDRECHLSGILCIGIDRTEQKRAEKVLERRVSEQAVAVERNRLARDLHDAVSQTLFSTSLIAEVLPRLWERNPEEGWRRLEEVRQLTRGALAEMRTLLLELRPAALVEADLGDLLRQLGEATAGRARVQVEVEVEGTCPLCADVKVALYRIAQEALNNVAKHASANHALVSLRCEENKVALCVCDDGRGFDVCSVPSDRFGLSNMRERAEAIGAVLAVQSEIGKGTQVRAIWMPDRGEEESDE